MNILTTCICMARASIAPVVSHSPACVTCAKFFAFSTWKITFKKPFINSVTYAQIIWYIIKSSVINKNRSNFQTLRLKATKLIITIFSIYRIEYYNEHNQILDDETNYSITVIFVKYLKSDQQREYKYSRKRVDSWCFICIPRYRRPLYLVS